MKEKKNTAPKGMDNTRPFDELYKERLKEDLGEYLRTQHRLMRAIANDKDLELLDFTVTESMGAIDFVSSTGAIGEIQEFLLAKTVSDYFEFLATPIREEETENDKDN